jgi:hypothetical protein
MKFSTIAEDKRSVTYHQDTISMLNEIEHLHRQDSMSASEKVINT